MERYRERPTEINIVPSEFNFSVWYPGGSIWLKNQEEEKRNLKIKKASVLQIVVKTQGPQKFAWGKDIHESEWWQGWMLERLFSPLQINKHTDIEPSNNTIL